MAIESIRLSMSGDSTGTMSRFQGTNVYQRNSADKFAQLEKLAPADAIKKESDNNSEDRISNDDSDQKRRFDTYECQTCENRKYQDGSDDSGVSYQMPTRIDPKNAAAAVRGHEQEHVVRNQAKAELEDKEIVSQSVTLHTGICEECGKVYISGGTTRTVTRDSNKEKFNVGMEGQEKGGRLDVAV